MKKRGGGNVRGSGARANRAAQAAGQSAGGAVASGGGNVRGSGARQNREVQARPQRVAQAPQGQQQQQSGSGGQRRPISPEMQKRLARTRVGDDAAKVVQKVNPKPGQTVTTQQKPQGTTATLTGGTGSVSGNVNKAKRIIKNQNVGPTTMGKIDDF